jgi:hypothetical protein
VIIAIRGSGDNALVDVRNLKTEDDILTKNVGVLRPELLVARMIGVDMAGQRAIVLKNGDSISDAVTALGGEGTIILLPGTYTGEVTLSSAITIMGVNRDSCNIVGSVTISATNCRLFLLKVTGQVMLSEVDVTIDSCYITHTVAAIAENISTSKAGWVKIVNCKVQSSGNDIYCINFTPGGTNTTFVEIRGCDIIGTGTGGTAGTQGISINNVWGATLIEGCRITCRTRAISVGSSSPYSIVSGCNVTVVGIDSTDKVIDLLPEYGMVTGCFITSTGHVFAGIFVGQDSVVQGNVIVLHYAAYAIGSSSDYTTIVGNTISGQTGTAAISYGGQYGAISGNRITGTHVIGIQMSNTTSIASGNASTASTPVSGGKKHCNVENASYVHGDTT